MMRLASALPLLLIACSEPEESTNNASSEQATIEAPVKDIDAIPVDENAAAAVGANDDAPATGER